MFCLARDPVARVERQAEKECLARQLAEPRRLVMPAIVVKGPLRWLVLASKARGRRYGQGLAELLAGSVGGGY